MGPEPSQTIQQRAHTVAGPEVPIFSQAVLQMEGNKTSSLSTMTVALINGKEATWDLTVCLEVSGLSTAHMGVCANSCLCWCTWSNRVPTSAGFLNTRKCKENIPSEMGKALEHTSILKHSPTQGCPPSPLMSQENSLHGHNPATAASWARHGGKQRHVVYHSCTGRCYFSLGDDDESVQEDGPGQVTPGT